MAYTPITGAVIPFLRGTDTAIVFDLVYTATALSLLMAVGVVVYRHLDDIFVLAVTRLSAGRVEKSVSQNANDVQDGKRRGVN